MISLPCDNDNAISTEIEPPWPCDLLFTFIAKNIPKPKTVLTTVLDTQGIYIYISYRRFHADSRNLVFVGVVFSRSFVALSVFFDLTQKLCLFLGAHSSPLRPAVASWWVFPVAHVMKRRMCVGALHVHIDVGTYFGSFFEPFLEPKDLILGACSCLVWSLDSLGPEFGKGVARTNPQWGQQDGCVWSNRTLNGLGSYTRHISTLPHQSARHNLKAPRVESSTSCFLAGCVRNL